MKSPALVKCPICAKPAEWSHKNTWRPFCSERCKLIDLGAWADGSYSVPDKEQVLPENDPEER